MRSILPVAALAAAALAVAACDKPRTQSAYINSGASATPAMPAGSPPSQPATVPSNEPLGQPDKGGAPAADAAAQVPNERPVTTAPATSDTASPNTAPPAK